MQSSEIIIMKTLLILVFLVMGSTHPRKTINTEYLLICTGKYSKSYHKDYKNTDNYCTGLKSCRADVVRLPADEAKAKRSDHCDYCYGH